MQFGNPDNFAIEAELREIHGKWLYGKLRFWVDRLPVGDFDDTSDLASSARSGRIFLAASSRRTRSDLDHLSAIDVYTILYGQYVVDISRVDAPHRRAPSGSVWDRDPYLLDDIGESAVRDKFAVLTVRRGDGRDRMIVRSFHSQTVSAEVLPSGYCDMTVASYCDWVEQLRYAPN
jgi:hypothetical protein